MHMYIYIYMYIYMNMYMAVLITKDKNHLPSVMRFTSISRTLCDGLIFSESFSHPCQWFCSASLK